MAITHPITSDLPAGRRTAGGEAPPARSAPVGRAGTTWRRRLTKRSAHWAIRAVSLGALLFVWYWLTSNDIEMWLRFSKIPGPGETLSALWEEFAHGDLVAHVQASLWRILKGFTLAAVAGIAFGVATGRSRWALDVMSPMLEVLRPIPAIAWVPIAILLFANGEQGMVFITFLAAVFPVIVSTRHAVAALPIVWEDAVRTMGGSRWTVLWRVVLPGTLPGIFAGLSVAMGVAWICLISAEMLSGQLGIGYYTWQSYALISYENVAAGMLTIGLLGLVSAGLVELCGRWCTRWLPRSEMRS